MEDINKQAPVISSMLVNRCGYAPNKDDKVFLNGVFPALDAFLKYDSIDEFVEIDDNYALRRNAIDKVKDLASSKSLLGLGRKIPNQDRVISKGKKWVVDYFYKESMTTFVVRSTARFRTEHIIIRLPLLEMQCKDNEKTKRTTRLGLFVQVSLMHGGLLIKQYSALRPVRGYKTKANLDLGGIKLFIKDVVLDNRVDLSEGTRDFDKCSRFHFHDAVVTHEPKGKFALY